MILEHVIPAEKVQKSPLQISKAVYSLMFVERVFVVIGSDIFFLIVVLTSNFKRLCLYNFESIEIGGRRFVLSECFSLVSSRKTMV